MDFQFLKKYFLNIEELIKKCCVSSKGLEIWWNIEWFLQNIIIQFFA